MHMCELLLTYRQMDVNWCRRQQHITDKTEKNKLQRERERKAPTGICFCISRTCRVQIRRWGWAWWWWWWRWGWLPLWFSGWGRLLHADRIDPKGFFSPVTFFSGAALLVSLEHVLAAAAAQSVPLQQFVHALDNTLQTFVDIHPHFFL